MNHFVIISGCSGGGKTALLEELSKRGHAVVAEPGRRVIAEERASGGQALPWVDLTAFASRAVEMALRDREQAKALSGWVFFDRGLIDAAAALQHATNRPVLADYAGHRFHRRVFLTPPWQEIFVNDADRQHGLDEAVAEYERLLRVYAALEYEVLLVPKTGIGERADFVIAALGQPADQS